MYAYIQVCVFICVQMKFRTVEVLIFRIECNRCNHHFTINNMIYGGKIQSTQRCWDGVFLHFVVYLQMQPATHLKNYFFPLAPENRSLLILCSDHICILNAMRKKSCKSRLLCVNSKGSCYTRYMSATIAHIVNSTRVAIGASRSETYNVKKWRSNSIYCQLLWAMERYVLGSIVDVEWFCGSTRRHLGKFISIASPIECICIPLNSV